MRPSPGGEEDVVVTPSAHGAARHQSGGEFGLAAWAEPPQFEQRHGHGAGAVDRENGLGFGLDEEDVIVLAAVFVGAPVRAPRLDERESTIPAGEIP